MQVITLLSLVLKETQYAPVKVMESDRDSILGILYVTLLLSVVSIVIYRKMSIRHSTPIHASRRQKWSPQTINLLLHH